MADTPQQEKPGNPLSQMAEKLRNELRGSGVTVTEKSLSSATQYFRKRETLSILRQIAAEFRQRSFMIRLTKYLAALKPDGTIHYQWEFGDQRDTDIIAYIQVNQKIKV